MLGAVRFELLPQDGGGLRLFAQALALRRLRRLQLLVLLLHRRRLGHLRRHRRRPVRRPLAAQLLVRLVQLLSESLLDGLLRERVP
jgi:hypothetical protein